MRVISRKAIRSFALQHREAAGPLAFWAQVTEAARWKDPTEVKQAFRSVDFVEGFTVFDIGGNKYRLIAFIHYRKQLVFIKQILTHRDYDKGKWKQ
jgi:mRNA interferase HigB